MTKISQSVSRIRYLDIPRLIHPIRILEREQRFVVGPLLQKSEGSRYRMFGRSLTGVIIIFHDVDVFFVCLDVHGSVQPLVQVFIHVDKGVFGCLHTEIGLKSQLIQIRPVFFGFSDVYRFDLEIPLTCSV